MVKIIKPHLKNSDNYYAKIMLGRNLKNNFLVVTKINKTLVEGTDRRQNKNFDRRSSRKLEWAKTRR